MVVASPPVDGPAGSVPAGPQLTIVEHLTELRRRVLVVLLAVVAGSVLAWFGYGRVVTFMVHPYRQFLTAHPGIDVSGGNLVTTAPLEGFTTRLQVSGCLGAALAAPVGLWQMWRFVAPGLYRRERRYAVGFVGAAALLFSIGVVTAAAVFPKAIDWMISVSGPGVAPLFTPSRYFSLYAMAALVFGAVFTYPVFLVALELTGVVTSRHLRRWRRYAIVACCAVAAVITPSSDPFSFLAMAVPMVVFYEAAIVVGRVLHR